MYKRIEELFHRDSEKRHPLSRSKDKREGIDFNELSFVFCCRTDYRNRRRSGSVHQSRKHDQSHVYRFTQSWATGLYFLESQRRGLYYWINGKWIKDLFQDRNPFASDLLEIQLFLIAKKRIFSNVTHTNMFFQFPFNSLHTPHESNC